MINFDLAREIARSRHTGEVEVELRLGSQVRHVWVDDVPGVSVGAMVRLETEDDWWRVARLFGRREVAPIEGIAMAHAPASTTATGHDVLDTGRRSIDRP